MDEPAADTPHLAACDGNRPLAPPGDHEAVDREHVGLVR